jgi:hypothetical protein
MSLQPPQPPFNDTLEQLREWAASEAEGGCPPPMEGLCSLARVEGGPLDGVACMGGQQEALLVRRTGIESDRR